MSGRPFGTLHNRRHRFSYSNTLSPLFVFYVNVYFLITKPFGLHVHKRLASFSEQHLWPKKINNQNLFRTPNSHRLQNWMSRKIRKLMTSSKLAALLCPASPCATSCAGIQIE